MADGGVQGLDGVAAVRGGGDGEVAVSTGNMVQLVCAPAGV